MLVLLGLVGLLMISFPSTSPVHPAVFGLFGKDASTLECRPDVNPSEVNERTRPTRTANFRVSGSYRCRRPVFEPGERNPLTDEILAEEESRAPKVAAQVRAALGTDRPAGAISVAVSGLGEPAVEEKVAAMYRRELTMHFAAGSIARQALDPSKGPQLRIELRRTEEPTLMATARLSRPQPKGEPSWQEL